MITSTDGRAAAITSRAPVATVTVTPVLDGERPVGAWIAGPDSAVFRPVIDVTRLVGTALAAAGAVAIATVTVAAATRRRPAIGSVTMGPGGWVSVKRAPTPPLRSGAARPWWARLLRARRLVVER
jgi:hypothetical protein